MRRLTSTSPIVGAGVPRRGVLAMAAAGLLWRTTHNLVEGAGAASVAAALKLKDRFTEGSVACVLSGGNLDTDTLRAVFGVDDASTAGESFAD